MIKRDQVIAGVIVVVAIVVVYFVSLFAVLNRNTSVKSPKPTAGVGLEQEIIPILEGLELNGQLPVTTSPEELGKDDPFAP